MRERCGKGDYVWTQILRNMPEKGTKPRELPPAGLSRERQQYLFTQIREHCRPGTEDDVCPAPPPVAEHSKLLRHSTHVTLLPMNIFMCFNPKRQY